MAKPLFLIRKAPPAEVYSQFLIGKRSVGSNLEIEEKRDKIVFLVRWPC